MSDYSAHDVLRLARRVNNTRRNYLLVNPLQGKHMPVPPRAALDMMKALGERLARKYPDARLIVGFAETATAIGAAVASCFPPDCLYMHTTREELSAVQDWILFQEEHSHAPEQKLVAEGFLRGLTDSPTVLFIEDEISTGRTLRNMICQLRGLLPGGEARQMVAASIINRMSPENERMLAEAGIACECLVRLPEDDFTAAADQFDVTAARPVTGDAPPCRPLRVNAAYADPRQGVPVGEYNACLEEIIRQAAAQLREALPQAGRLLVLGTEECMYPALMLGRGLEEQGVQVFSHSTTRSPIGICSAEGYPITAGWGLESLYQAGRRTFIYDLAAYDAAVIVTDASANAEQGLRDLTAALAQAGTTNTFCLKL